MSKRLENKNIVVTAAGHRRGKIRPGFDADLTFLNQDITECPEKEILKTEVLGTMVAGEFIFNKLN